MLIVFGTRPEAIKMVPIIKALRELDHLQTHICVTGQHKEMLHSVLQLFDIEPDYDLNLMKQGQSLVDITTGVLNGLKVIFESCQYDLVFVHGDTTTTLSAALAAFYHKIPVAHVEAGLRTYNIHSPWPEELNRRVTGICADYHFAPTTNARLNLLAEGVAEDRIFVTGNTVIDALYDVHQRIQVDPSLSQPLLSQFSYLRCDRRMILVTCHRRENFGKNLEQICLAIQALAKRPDIQIVLPVHCNPNVQIPVREMLANLDHVFLIEPQEYVAFVYLMSRATMIITDSGGVQEEAPSLGKPVLVIRETTERPEAVSAGTVKLIGTQCQRIIEEVNMLLDNSDAYHAMARAHNPYGDGKAASRIRDSVASLLLQSNIDTMAVDLCS